MANKIIDGIERLLFGATAQERVDMIVKIAEQRIEDRLVAALERDDETYEAAEKGDTD